ncbi:metal ABC transporter permease [Actinomyces gaoshouyii]|uniref:metal ABC transporter permease n=1 Tax=Actinomyces gaoshouyii TaxID=1960083 RepID=UPI0009BD0ED2|nr:zinc ABC transporter permease [Actinomyces gaoshouyii]
MGGAGGDVGAPGAGGLTDVSLGLLALPALEAVLMGLLAGLVGALALLSRRVFFTESLTHATFPGAIIGVVVATWIAAALGHGRPGFELLSAMLLVGAALMCLPMAALMRALARVEGLGPQSAAGIVLTIGSALGYFLAGWFKPLPLKIDSFLTGSVLNVGRVDVAAVGAVLVVAVAVVALTDRALVFHAFDPVGHRAAGLRAGWAEGAVLVLITSTIVVLVPAVGTILPIALIAAPAAALAPSARSARGLLIGAPLLGAASALVGLVLGVALRLSVGGMIAAIVAAVYLVAVCWRAIRRGSPVPRADRP